MVLVSIKYFPDNFPARVIIVWEENLYQQICDLSQDAVRCLAEYIWIKVVDHFS